MNNQQLPNQVVTTQKQDLLNQREQFMLIAKKIGKELTNTCIKLEKLTDLAKKRSLFDDKPKEIQNLTNNIKEDINNLHSEISRLQQLVKANKNVEGKNMQKHSFNVVFTLQSKLANVSKDFKNVLEVRNENLKQQTERGEQFFSKNTLNPSSAASVFAAPKMPGSNNMGKSVLLYDGSSGQSGLNTYNNNPSKQQHGETVLNMDQMQQKQQLQHRLIVNEEDSFLRDRANAMQTVEQTIIELGGMFQQLATMIKEQDEAIQRIDSNVDDVDMNVNEAHSELLKYFQSVTSNRWLMIKIFLVLIVFFVVFIVVI
jgi:syntaxin 5